MDAVSKWNDLSCELSRSSKTEPLTIVSLNEISKLIYVRSGDSFFADDVEFFIVERHNDLVVVPEMTLGWLTAVSFRWIDSLANDSKLAFGLCAAPPIQWRKRLLGLIPIGPGVRLFLETSPLDSFKASGELSIKQEGVIAELWRKKTGSPSL